MIGTVDTTYIYNKLESNSDSNHTYRVKVIDEGDKRVVYSYDTIIYTCVGDRIVFDNEVYSNTTGKHQRAIQQYLENNYYIKCDYKEKNDRWVKRVFNFIIIGNELFDVDALDKYNVKK